MKTTSRTLTGFTLLVFTWPLAAQLPSPFSRQVEPGLNNYAIAPDGIVIDHGHAFLLRYGRAALINRTLVPEGKILTWEGRLIPVPSGFSVYSNAATESDGIMVYGGKAFVLHQGRVSLINASVIPRGQVLTRNGRLVPLPADFSVFVLDRPGNSQPMSVDTRSPVTTKRAIVPDVPPVVPQVQPVVSLQAPEIPEVPQNVALPPSGSSVPRATTVATAPIPSGPNGVVVNMNGNTGALLPSPADVGMSPSGADSNADGTVVSNELVLDQSRFTPASPNGALAKQARANFTANVTTTTPAGRVPNPTSSGTQSNRAVTTARTTGGVLATSESAAAASNAAR